MRNILGERYIRMLERHAARRMFVTDEVECIEPAFDKDGENMNPTERFGTRAKDYAAHRPGYPEEVIDYILDGLGDSTKLIAADVGAGTGISSRALAERGVRVIAVEPNAAMRASAEEHERVEWRDGTAEATGLGDKSVDLTASFQAFHWFANDAALEEFRRITRQRIVLVQYERDETVPVSHALGDIYRAYALDDTEALRMCGMDFFSGFPGAIVSRTTIRWKRQVTLDQLLGVVASSSYLPKTAPDSDRLRTDVQALHERYATDELMELGMQTFAVRADI